MIDHENNKTDSKEIKDEQNAINDLETPLKADLEKKESIENPEDIQIEQKDSEAAKTVKSGEKHSKKNDKSVKKCKGKVAVLSLLCLLSLVGLGAGLCTIYQQKEAKQVIKNLQMQLSQQKDQVDQLKQSSRQQEQKLSDLEQSQIQQKQEIVNNRFKVQQEIQHLTHHIFISRDQISAAAQLVFKQNLMTNLSAAQQAWQVLGSKKQALFSLNQAKKNAENIQSSSAWIMQIESLSTLLENSRSIMDNFSAVLILQVLFTQLHVQNPGYNAQASQPRAKKNLSWEDRAKASWQKIKSLVVVKKIDEKDKAFFDPSTRFQIFSSLYNLALQLKLSVINNDAVAIHKTKLAIQNQVNDYFVKDAESHAVLDQLMMIKNAETANFDSKITQLTNQISGTNTDQNNQNQISGGGAS